MEMDLSLLQGEFDCIILGTGLIECTLSGILSKDGMRVLVLDKNDYYGGGCASLTLSQLHARHNKTPTNEELVKKFGGPAGASSLEQRRWLNCWNVDLIPKFIMGSGLLSRILVHTGVTKYIQFQKAAGSFVYKEGKIHKVPGTAAEALSSGLMGFFEKRKCHKLLQHIEGWKADDPKTHQGISPKAPFRAVYDKYGVDENTRSFVGHAVGLYTDDSYMDLPSQQVIERIMIYRHSFFTLGGGSPYVYPRHGLSELPQSFARQGAVYGATTMLRAPLEQVLFDDAGVAKGIKLRVGDSETIDVATKYLIGDPSYFPDRVHPVGKVLRMMAILDHPIPNTGNAHSAQIIIPQKESQLSHDIYILCFSSQHCVVPEGKYLAIISTELNERESKLEPNKVLGGAVRLLGPVLELFTSCDDLYEPNSEDPAQRVFISKSYDGTGTFQSSAENILSIYEKIAGKPLVLTKGEETDENEE